MEPPPIPAMDADHPDLYIPEPVKNFLPYFQRTVADKVGYLHFRLRIHFYVQSRLQQKSRSKQTEQWKMTLILHVSANFTLPFLLRS